MGRPLDEYRAGIKRWLKRGLLSGTGKGIVSGVTDILFFLSFAVCFSWEFINTTMFKKGFSDSFELRMDSLYHIVVIIALVCGLIAVLMQESLYQAVFEAVLLAAGLLHWKVGGGEYEIFVLCVLIVGMTGRSFRALLTIAFTIGGILMAAAFAASQLGIIEDLVYDGGRHSFGIVYCTDCAAHILFLMMMYVMLRRDELKIPEYVLLVFAQAIMMMTKAQSDVACGFLLLAGVLVYRLTRRWRRSAVMKFLGRLACLSFFLCTAASFIITLGFNRNDMELRKKMQYSLIRRLEMNQQALKNNPCSLFGIKVEEHGFGGRTTNLPNWDKYFFIDCSYIRLFVIGGLLLFVLILLMMTYTQLRCFAYRNYGFVFLLALLAVSCLMEHHLMEYFYNVFPLMAFSGGRFLKETGNYSRKSVRVQLQEEADPAPGSGQAPSRVEADPV